MNNHTELDKQAREWFRTAPEVTAIIMSHRGSSWQGFNSTEVIDLAAAFASQVRQQSIAEVEQKFKEFVEQYARLNGIRTQLATPKYDRYVEGASDFADFLSIPSTKSLPAPPETTEQEER